MPTKREGRQRSEHSVQWEGGLARTKGQGQASGGPAASKQHLSP